QREILGGRRTRPQLPLKPVAEPRPEKIVLILRGSLLGEWLLELLEARAVAHEIPGRPLEEYEIRLELPGGRLQHREPVRRQIGEAGEVQDLDSLRNPPRESALEQSVPALLRGNADRNRVRGAHDGDPEHAFRLVDRILAI